MNPDGSLLVDTYGVEDINISVQLLHNIILNDFYVRNTKQSIGQEYDVPEVNSLMLVCHLIFLQLLLHGMIAIFKQEFFRFGCA